MNKERLHEPLHMLAQNPTKWSLSPWLPLPRISLKYIQLEMWANAQRDGRPAEYRWRPLFNAAVWLTPTTSCRAVTLPRRVTRWKYLGCPKLTKGSQPLVGRSSPYYGDMWRRYCCLTSFFRLSILALVALRRYSPTKLCVGAEIAIFCVLYFQRAARSMFQTCILNSH